MRVLLVGGGGREHALAWKLRREHPALEIVAAPGNPGIAALGRCVPVAASDVDALVALAEAERPDFTLVGPEAPLAEGLVDRMRARGLAVFGPTRAAARLETSKAFAKQLMLDAGVPTAHATRHADADDAKRAARALGAPVVVKASGLAAGKGVIVAATLAEADAAIDDMLVANRFGAAGAEVLVEAFMEGEELSLFFLTDGHAAIALPGAQDHKRLLAGDTGPNTGGMGAYAPVTPDERTRAWLAAHGFDAGTTAPPLPDDDRAWAEHVVLAAEVASCIVDPVLAAMRERGTPFTGLLYAGLMLTADGPRVVEFNCRFGDPETQAVLPLLDAGEVGLLDHLGAIARGERLSAGVLGLHATAGAAAVTTVLAAAGYPDPPRTGHAITLPEETPEGIYLFHAGTARDSAGRLVTAGGRVLAVTAVADTFARAQALARATAEQVQFAGKQFRPDIGWREAARRGEDGRTPS
ncbi:MAG TPA: phosphoribosylamine--glycine ligase [Gemmatirosa sp.]|nr:phosphoribosylamine--glycine ligase [Gemmatirosa sp.]